MRSRSGQEFWRWRIDTWLKATTQNFMWNNDVPGRFEIGHRSHRCRHRHREAAVTVMFGDDPFLRPAAILVDRSDRRARWTRHVQIVEPVQRAGKQMQSHDQRNQHPVWTAQETHAAVAVGRCHFHDPRIKPVFPGTTPVGRVSTCNSVTSWSTWFPKSRLGSARARTQVAMWAVGRDKDWMQHRPKPWQISY